ncbi:porin [Chryseosolibacter indicus]|uniref:Outer membrane beta-barrel protein n=1 Tax=Chryseosolibacter indicus TaxID=2782351 RepID=A0ABS5VX01_9BACT|nr:porin [Chryseosolibacter indicus]MBT1705945.1 outer membrane beta-barrel protein [Chryseosolibacter indicus]
MKTLLFLFIPLAFVTPMAFAQEESEPSPFTVSGYIETYYTYDFNKPKGNTRPGFIYSFNRHNEVNLNLGFIKGSYTSDNVRANLALMSGTYANANLAAEPGVLKNVLEANAGIKLSTSKNLWVDAGIFGSHIGFESAIGKDCWNLTRSILADNTPYYEAGAKISYTTDNGKWFLSGLILNGWQRMQRVEGNSLPSFGTQITFKPSAAVTLNSSSFIGTDKPDSARQMRYFHNFYGIFQVSEKVGIIAGFDYGIEEKSPETGSTNSWVSPILVARFNLNDKASFVVRGEYYQDEHGVIIATGTANGFKTTGISANFDYQVMPNALWRMEVRNLKSKDKIFEDGDGVSTSNTFVSTSLAISF